MANSSVRVWQFEERVTLHILHTEFKLNTDQIHDIFGRIYGAAWVTAGRGIYKPQRLRDEWVQRFSGRKSNDWNDIDKASFTPEQEDQREAARQAIRDAAKQSGTPNIFKNNQPDAPIKLKSAKTAYVFDPAAKKAKQTATAPAAGKKRKSGRNTQGTDDEEDDDITAVTPAPKKKKKVTEVAKKVTVPKKKKTTTPASSLHAVPSPELPDASYTDYNAGVDQQLDTTRSSGDIAVPEGLLMVHSSLVDNSTSPPTVDLFHAAGFVEKDSALHQYGGPVQHVQMNGQTFDVVLCAKEDCTFCQTDASFLTSLDEIQEAADVAANAPHLLPHVSEYRGLPFVHSQDLQFHQDGSKTFKPQAREMKCEVPQDKSIEQVLFDDTGRSSKANDGGKGVRKALVCVHHNCEVCRSVVYGKASNPPQVPAEPAGAETAAEQQDTVMGEASKTAPEVEEQTNDSLFWDLYDKHEHEGWFNPS